MGWKGAIISKYAQLRQKRILNNSVKALNDQKKIFNYLIKKAESTAFGKDHGFKKISKISEFQSAVPVRDYEGLKHYFDKIALGEKSICWPGHPKYLAKTSGTTSGIKYIPLTKDSIGSHVMSASDATLNYIAQKEKASLLEGKAIFLSGSPELEDLAGMPVGRLSGISNLEVPAWLRTNQLPSYETNCIDDWEEKLDAIVLETFKSDLRIIGGIPPWVHMYYERLLDFTGKKYIKDIFPNFGLFVYGGVNYEPYRQSLEKLVGASIDSVELFPASEGFIAYQDQFPHTGMLLNTNIGIFYEFIRLDEFHDENPKRYWLGEVETDIDYVLILSSNAGLWAYNLGDTVKFTSLEPYRLIVSGRVKHYISAFGEHVISKEVEEAMTLTMTNHDCSIVEFTVAPLVETNDNHLPCHQWFIEFEKKPKSIEKFSLELDKVMCAQNIYYKDLIEGKIMSKLMVLPVASGGFQRYMQSIGKLGGQNKVPRLSNDRKIADSLLKIGVER